MQQAFNQFLQFLEQGISLIFRLVDTVWSWVGVQIQNLMSVPWQNWPLLKQVILGLVILGVAIALFKVVSELWSAGERILAAFATLIGVFVRTIPSVAIAGLIALGGLWTLNNVDLSAVKLPITWQTTADSPAQNHSVQ
jgi:hypothetical protein